MTQPGDANQQAISYMQYQGAKGLKELAGLVERTAADWSRCLEDISEEQAEFKPVLSGVEGPVLSGVEGPVLSAAAAEGVEWCVKEVLGHFLEATHGVNRQVAQVAAGKAPRELGDASPGHLPTDARSSSIEELRRQVIDVLQEARRLTLSLPEDGRLTETFNHPFFGPLNLKEWIAFQRIHSLDHIQQVEQIRASPGYPKH